MFDLPPPRLFVTQHQVEKASCSHCRCVQRVPFPEHVNAPVQYGSGLAAWTVYLHAYLLLPLDRIARLFDDLTRHRPSEAEHDGHVWAQQMSDLLEESWQLASASRQAETPLSVEVILGLQKRYDAILKAGQHEWAKDPVRTKTGTRGRKIKSKAGNLGERLLLHKTAILSFFCEPKFRLTIIRRNEICAWQK